MSLLQAITARPWLPDTGIIAQRPSAALAAIEARRFALRVFLAVVSILFLLLLTAYAGRMAYEDWRPAPQMRLLWANTAVLLLASASLQWALFGAGRLSASAVRAGTLAAVAMTGVFLYGQLLAWSQLAAMELVDIRNPAIGFFYLITGLHGIHLLGGLAVLGRTTWRAFGAFDAEAVRHSLENCVLYWHFLLLVWLVLFGLLFSGNNFELLLEICGIR